MLGEITVLLMAVAVGLTVLDFTCFVALRVSAEIGRSRFGVKPAEQVMPSVNRSSFGYALALHPPVRIPAALYGFALWNVLVLGPDGRRLCMAD